MSDRAIRVIRSWAWAVVVAGLFAVPLAWGQVPPAGEQLRDAPRATDVPDNKADPATRPALVANPATHPATTSADDPVARIRDEGLNRSQVMQTLSYLTDVIGPRLTGSPNLRRANEWTRDRMAAWGMANAHLEAWGPFGRGWSLRRYSAQVVEPQCIPLIGAPKAWSPGFDAPLTADVVYLDAQNVGDLDKYKGKLKGAIVLASPPRDVQARFEPLASRVPDANLLQLANADPVTNAAPGQARAITPGERRALLETGPLARLAARGGATRPDGPANGPTTGPTTGPAGAAARGVLPARVLSFLADEGAAVVVTPSTQGDGGTFFVSSVSLPTPAGRGAGGPGNAGGPGGAGGGPRPWAMDAPPATPQIMLAAEDYNRLVRMIRQSEHLKIALDLEVQFHDADPMAYNTIAEIPGTDLKDQIVMLGAHMDSWHSGTGATDNGAGVAAVMEAARILRALDLQPRRTIRVGLWTGEEEGLLGSKAYVAKHFGTYDNPATLASAAGDPPPRVATAGQGRRGGRGRRGAPATQPTAPASASESLAGSGGANGPNGPAVARQPRTLYRQEEYERLSVYFNLDNGTGKVRGVYMQGNEAARPIFRTWLAPFHDLGADTLTPANTGGTDHLSFDAIGLPGFQFIQDPIEYWTRTHHSNEDVFDRVQAEDLKQASVILAAFAYDAAMADERFPRKPPATEQGGRGR